MANVSQFFVATRKGLFTVTRQDKQWAVAQAQFLGENLSMVMPDTKHGVVYAAFDHGHFGVKLQRSLDGGATWEHRTVPAYPELAEGEELIVDEMGRTIPNTLKKIWCLESDSRGRLWCGTIPGGLFHSDDQGETWELNRALWDQPSRRKWMGGGADYPGIHSICINPDNPDQLHVGISSGGVWYSEDRGKTWSSRCKGMRAEYMPPERSEDPEAQDPHRIVQCPADTNTLWIQHHNGIFHTTNGGAQWTEIKQAGPSTFGFAVVVHPRDAKTAWFVPGIKDEQRIPSGGRVVVTRTRDGGKSFDVLTKGLPGTHAYDLVYRHAMDISGDGSVLAFGSTTGSLWVSEDQGDSWQAVSHHLPPIYAVRFG